MRIIAAICIIVGLSAGIKQSSIRDLYGQDF